MPSAAFMRLDPTYFPFPDEEEGRRRRRRRRRRSRRRRRRRVETRLRYITLGCRRAVGHFIFHHHHVLLHLVLYFVFLFTF